MIKNPTSTAAVLFTSIFIVAVVAIMGGFSSSVTETPTSSAQGSVAPALPTLDVQPIATVPTSAAPTSTPKTVRTVTAPKPTKEASVAKKPTQTDPDPAPVVEPEAVEPPAPVVSKYETRCIETGGTYTRTTPTTPGAEGGFCTYPPAPERPQPPSGPAE